MNAGDVRQRWAGIARWLGPAAVYGISFGCLYWVYRDFDWENQLPRLQQIHWIWILLAVCCDILVYVSQAWRWNMLLSPIKQIPLGRSVQAIYIGLFANELLPLRSGEAIRCYLQHHWSGISFPVAVSSALIERLIDGVWLILGFFLTTQFVKLDASLKYGASILAALVVCLALLLVYAVQRPDEAHDAFARYRWLSVLRHLMEGLHTMGRSQSFLWGAAGSLVYMLLQVVPLYAMIRGYGLNLTFGHAAVVLVILRLGTVIPGPPGNIGLFNAFAVLALKMLGVEEQVAKGLSGVMFFVITVPLLVAGCIALALTGSKIREIQKRAVEIGQQRHPHPDGAGVRPL